MEINNSNNNISTSRVLILKQIKCFRSLRCKKENCLVGLNNLN